MQRFRLCCALPAALLAWSLPSTAIGAAARADTGQSAEAAPPSASEETPADRQGPMPVRVYEPSYFDRFAPRNALDMLEQLPGFLLQGGGGNDRGFGQANENVLVNGERLSSKSDSAQDQLRRIPAGKVVRIEIVEGTSLDIPGLTGQVANVIVDAGGISGQFTWEGSLRTTAVDPEWYGGEISISGSSGALEFTLALENNNDRFGGTGPTLFTDGMGEVFERQHTVFTGGFDLPRISALIGYDFGGGVAANLNLAWEHSFFDRDESEVRSFPAAPPIHRQISFDSSAPNYEISGDLAFPLGKGRIKLIGLESYDGGDASSRLVDMPTDGSAASGNRFDQVSDAGERIARFEYNWPMWGADFQLAAEAAFNRLDRSAMLFTLGPDGRFDPVPFPNASGGVREKRYESVLSMSRQLAPTLALQASIGGEYSRIRQSGSAANSRSFRRPKGAISLAWQPREGLDISLGLERRVGQLDFGDFLASVQFDANNQNAGNNELVPSQTWEAVLEISTSLGDWGSTAVMFEQRWIDDYTDIVPLPGGGESRGNIDSARRTEIEWTTTLQLARLGWRGAQMDIRLEYEEGEVRDPVTGRIRDFSGGRDREVEIDLRHDIPGSDFAYGAGFIYNRIRPSFRVSQVTLEEDVPLSAYLFVEHKDVLGLTVNLEASNLLGGNTALLRTVYDGPRDAGQVRFIEDRDYRVGPIFRFSVSGNF